MTFHAPFWSPSHASAFLFDWDGVIAETRLDFSGVREKYFGARKAMLLEDASALPPGEREAFMRDLEEIEVRGAEGAKPVPGIFALLELIDGRRIPWAVVSRNCRKSILTAADRIGVKLPPTVRSRDDGRGVKPDPAALVETCEALSAPCAQTVLIGDYIYDMIGARRAGMRGVLVRGEACVDWAPWLECHYTSMRPLLREMTHPTDLVPWEYLDALEKFGPGFLSFAHGLRLRVPLDASPSLDAWISRAASLGVGRFAVDREIFSPVMWRRNPSLDPSCMGKDLDETLRGFLRARYPFASVEGPEGGKMREAMPSPSGADEIQGFVVSLWEGR
ncbi:MAG: HAD hydrolase-like protein [Synergistaceae bacterium]|nr:HAD hydrolase-like protein [Synergistaceae bacterium]